MGNLYMYLKSQVLEYGVSLRGVSFDEVSSKEVYAAGVAFMFIILASLFINW